ncbi:MAG: FG-GAP-like repeat-containing protein [Cyclobacteriaceae bacterium]|nr:FG-GAP-like repeat-containing protein [Cyclobacteriaceae bacterium]
MKKPCISLFTLVSILVILSCGREKKAEKESSETKNSTAAAVSHKSVGLAYLEENNLEKAEEQFLQLIQITPEDASGYANLGVVYLRMGRLDDAEKYLLKAVDLAPNDPDIRVNLAKVYELKDDRQSSLEQLKKSEDVDPEHVKTLFSIAKNYEGGSDAQSVAQWETYMKKIVESSPTNIVARLYLSEALIQNKKDDEALKNLEEVQKIFPAFSAEANEYLGKTIESLHAHSISDALTSLLIFHNFLKLTAEYQSGIRELKGTQGAAIGVPVITMNQQKSELQEGESILDIIRFKDATEGAELDIINARISELSGEIVATIALGDMDRDGDQDIYYGGYVADRGQAFHYLLQSDFGRFKDITAKSGMNHQGNDQSATFIDYDNDGFLDVFVANESSNVLYQNVSEGKFSDVTKQAKLSGNGKNVLFVDLDHEGDLDFIISRNGKNAVWQNNGDKTFTDISASSGLAANSFESNAWAFSDLDNDGDIDLLVANTNGPLQVFSNSRKGVFMDITEKSGINFPSGSNDVEVFDYDNDGNMDVLAVSEKGIALFHNNGAGSFELSDYSDELNKLVLKVRCLDASVVDFDNDGFTDIIFVGRALESGRFRTGYST